MENVILAPPMPKEFCAKMEPLLVQCNMRLFYTATSIDIAFRPEKLAYLDLEPKEDDGEWEMKVKALLAQEELEAIRLDCFGLRKKAAGVLELSYSPIGPCKRVEKPLVRLLCLLQPDLGKRVLSIARFYSPLPDEILQSREPPQNDANWKELFEYFFWVFSKVYNDEERL